MILLFLREAPFFMHLVNHAGMGTPGEDFRCRVPRWRDGIEGSGHIASLDAGHMLRRQWKHFEPSYRLT